MQAVTLLEQAGAVFGLDPAAGLQLWAADALLRAVWPQGLPDPTIPTDVCSYAETQGLGTYLPPSVPFPLTPTVPALIWWAPEVQPQSALAALLQTRYPPTHQVQVAAFTAPAYIAAPLAALPSQILPPNEAVLLYLPPLAIQADERGAEGLRWVMARLLGPGGCPWDVRQRHQDLRGALLEETYEALEALEAEDMAGLSEELGDLLLAIFAHSEMARQAGHFAVEDVFAQVISKLIRRHPHVFGDLAVDGAATVLHNWEAIKGAELAAKGRSRPSALDGVPPGLPALATAQKLAKKASRTGFAWTNADQVWAKVHEELAELEAALAAGDQAHASEELGDVLFTLGSLADWHKLDAEMALRDVNQKFRRRFTALEAAVVANGRTIAEHTLPELLALWRAHR
ncbi:MAG: nucleoside triphosphate pyrophosphohydrolase [Oscillochloridaceae bacterium umkhey_bin13]